MQAGSAQAERQADLTVPKATLMPGLKVSFAMNRQDEGSSQPFPTRTPVWEIKSNLEQLLPFPPRQRDRNIAPYAVENDFQSHLTRRRTGKKP